MSGLLRKLAGAASVLAETWQGLNATDAGVQSILEYLAAFGYLREDNATPANLADAIRRLQAQAGFTIDGVPGDQTQSVLSVPRCGVREHIGAQQGKWGKNEFRYAVLSYVPLVDRMSQDQAIDDALNRWSVVSNVRFIRVSDSQSADLIISASNRRDEEFGQRGGVLGWCETPTTSNWSRPLQMKLDMSEAWTVSLLIRVAGHEGGHFLGYGHSRIKTAWMAPFVSETDRPVEPDDISLAVEIYGKPVAPPPAGGEWDGRYRVTEGGLLLLEKHKLVRV